MNIRGAANDSMKSTMLGHQKYINRRFIARVARVDAMIDVAYVLRVCVCVCVCGYI